MKKLINKMIIEGAEYSAYCFNPLKSGQLFQMP